MKTLLALTVLTLICFPKHNSAKPVAVDMISNVECCEAVTNKIHIPVTKVMNVMKTSGCNLEAIIVTTLIKRKICLDPEWKHAQMHLEEFKKRSASTTLKPETTKEMNKNFSSTTLKPTTT